MNEYDAAFDAATKGGSASAYDDIMKSLMSQVAPTPVAENAPASVKAGAAVNDNLGGVPRQLGLTARYGIQALGKGAELFTEPIRYLLDKATPDRAPTMGQLVTGERTPKSMPLGAVASQFSDYIGLPKPETANERVVGDATQLGFEAMGLSGGVRRLGGVASDALEFASNKAAPVFQGVTQRALQALGQAPAQQVASAAGAGLAGGASREAGGGPWQQTGAALLGSVVGGLTPSGLQTTVNAGKRFVSRSTPQQLDAQISLVLERSGVDYSQIPERARQSLRQDLSRALQAGEDLDPAAVRRLADFRLTGVTPTRGAITQDPVQITREMNLAKTGANSADAELQGLPRLQNQNNARLIQNLNEAGASGGDQFRAGQTAIGSIQSRDNALERNVSSLYQQARDTSGRAADLDRQAFASRVSELLDEAMVGGALPADVQNKINWIASNAKPQGMHGSIPMPFNVDIAEQLKTQIAKLQRNTSDGSARHALGLVRQALDETPLMQATKVNQGNLPAVPGTVPPSPSVLGQQSIDAFNQARQAARERFQWRESARPIEAAVSGAQPDKFVQQFVINGTVDDATALARTLPESARNEIRSAILDHIKKQAISGADDEVGKVSQSAFRKAIEGIGDRKLSLFFTPQELASLRANSRVASYLQVQPVGSAVNNSNSAAMLIGKGLDALAGVANATPLVGPWVTQPLTSGIKNLNVAIQTSRAQNITPGLLAPQQQAPVGARYLLPASAYAAGLLASP